MIKINLEIEDEVIEYTLPENWDEVTVEQFVKIFSINREGLALYEIATQTINCFTDIKVEHLEMMDYKDYIKITELLKFTEKDVVPVTVEYVELNGEKYYLGWIQAFHNNSIPNIRMKELYLSTNIHASDYCLKSTKRMIGKIEECSFFSQNDYNKINNTFFDENNN